MKVGFYRQVADNVQYVVWAGNDMEVRYMRTFNVPEWLTTILTAAHVGGHEDVVRHDGLSETHVWFEMDMDNSLLRFVKRDETGRKRRVSSIGYIYLNGE